MLICVLRAKRNCWKPILFVKLVQGFWLTGDSRARLHRERGYPERALGGSAKRTLLAKPISLGSEYRGQKHRSE